MSRQRVRLALTIGDPGGIGPEITASLIVRGRLPDADLYIVGSAASLKEALPTKSRNGYEVIPYGDVGTGDRPSSFPAVIDTGIGFNPPLGRPTREGGRVAGLAIETAISLALAGRIEGIVTGPVSKEALHMAGYPYNGHTGMLAELLESPDCQMMMVAGDLRVVILTRDIPLRDVPAAVTGERIKTGVRVTSRALRELWGLESPRIAVGALNPHAGDGGVIGREEKDVIVPAIEELRIEGLDVAGPIPADTLFYRWNEKGYDAFVALYHDQGMIPFKSEGFENGVNMTVGLPIVRTSVCHGTAFDIAGMGLGRTGSLEAAGSLAVRCCLMKRKGLEV